MPTLTIRPDETEEGAYHVSTPHFSYILHQERLACAPLDDRRAFNNSRLGQDRNALHQIWRLIWKRNLDLRKLGWNSWEGDLVRVLEQLTTMDKELFEIFRFQCWGLLGTTSWKEWRSKTPGWEVQIYAAATH